MRFPQIFIALIAFMPSALAQQSEISGRVSDAGVALPFATVHVSGTSIGTVTNDSGIYILRVPDNSNVELICSFVGYEKQHIYIGKIAGKRINQDISMVPLNTLNEVVVSGTLREVSRMESPVPVEVYSPAFFCRNPTPSVFESMQSVNGVRPQINCNICNTGDIHINGLEGPYTMVLIDGMPIVSGLSTVYGLSGIPSALIERVEVVKGPASSLYGSEAVGGMINIITKKTTNAPKLNFETYLTSWAELNTDLSLSHRIGKRWDVIQGISHFYFDQPIDKNGDGFTDMSLQNRLSLFQKWGLKRKKDRLFNMAFRYVIEDRWGGQLDWKPAFRGSDSIYAESIGTERWESFGAYQLPTHEHLVLSFSVSRHKQRSYYGITPFNANQVIGYSQLVWDKEFGSHNLLLGTTFRYTWYDDNTVATADSLINRPSIASLPGVFAQHEWKISKNYAILSGMRYDHHSVHGHIWTPRFGLKWKPAEHQSVRVNAGSGYRIVNVFTEDHAALTGARDVIIEESLKPERSLNANINYLSQYYPNQSWSFTLDVSSWYTFFSNRIFPDYQSDPNKIYYRNLDGYSVSKGAALGVDALFKEQFKLNAGITWMDVSVVENGLRWRPILTERFSAKWAVSYQLKKINTTIDYTGNLYSPMRLPLLGPLDSRDEFSPWWSIQNIKLSYVPKDKRWTFFGGVKNLLNYTPPANSIARAFDPFDKQVAFDDQGRALATDTNPNALTFDPSYVFAPNQGIRFFLGLYFVLP